MKNIEISSDLVIVGGGFAGVWAAMAAAKCLIEAQSSHRICLVSDRTHLVNRPRLYESQPQRFLLPIAEMLRAIDVQFVHAPVTKIDVDQRAVMTQGSEGETTLNWRRLVLAAGSRLAVPPSLKGAENAWDIDSVESASWLETHLASLTDGGAQEGGNTFVVVGSGLSGIELATEFRARLAVYNADLASSATIILLERETQLAPALGEHIRGPIAEALQDAGVDVKLGAVIEHIGPDYIVLASARRIATKTCVLCLGMRANPLTDQVPGQRDGLGRLFVDDTLCARQGLGVYAAGDVALAATDDQHHTLMSCQHSMRTGTYAGHNAASDLLGRDRLVYRQPDYRTCLALGPNSAVLTAGWERHVKLTGAAARSVKTQIVSQLIVPPPANREAIFTAVKLN